MNSTKSSLFLFLVILASLFAGGCRTKRSVSMSVTEPAIVYVPPVVDRVAIINRSQSTGETQKIDKIDKILSIEGKNFDQDGASEAIKGLYDNLTKNSDFSVIKIIDSTEIKSPGLGVFPASLAWGEVEELCDLYEVDAIFSLASYDTDTKIDYQTASKEISAPLGIKIPAIEHRAKVATNIKLGWRMYHPASKTILDEIMVRESVISQGKGINPAKAVEAVVGRKEAVMSASHQLGYQYASRLYPYQVQISRQYYVKGSKNLKVARRKAEIGDWDGAADLWQQEANSGKRKLAGRASYNMALIGEIEGNLTDAIDWASRSYAEYDNKDAKYYLRALKYREEQNRQLAAGDELE